MRFAPENMDPLPQKTGFSLTKMGWFDKQQRAFRFKVSVEFVTSFLQHKPLLMVDYSSALT